MSTAAYFLSDVLEASHGGFTSAQLWLTLAAEAALPAVVVGLYRVQRPQIGCLGRYGAAAYAAAYLYLTYTVIYALAHGTPDFTPLKQALNPAMTVFGAVMVPPASRSVPRPTMPGSCRAGPELPSPWGSSLWSPRPACLPPCS